jgi:hypothetical protein
MQAFVNCNVTAWAIFSDKQLLSKDAGSTLEESRQVLEGLLKSMERSNTSAIYTLCLYEDIKDRKKIKISTEPDFSYNFMLFDAEEYPAPGAVTRREGYRQILDEIDLLKAQLALKTKEEEEDSDETEGVGERPGGIMGMIDKLLDNPRVQEKLGERMMTWFDTLLSPAPVNDVPMNKQIGAMGNNGQEGLVQITQDQADKIQQSIAILAVVDPQLGDNLEKIAQLAQKNPKKYLSMIHMLNTFL